ncbi:hypothetical protein HMPREF0308_0734, partial [Corynebacterium striatum ATCC 6940]
GTDSKSRSRHYPRLPRGSESVYPHESVSGRRIVETNPAALSCTF